MSEETLFRHFLVFRSGTTVVGIGIDANATTGREQTYYLNILRIHQFDQVLHDDVHTVLMEIPMVTEAEEVEFQTLALHHSLSRYVENPDFCEIGLTCNRAKRGELRTVELHPIIVLRMTVLECLQHLRGVGGSIVGLLTKQLQPLLFSVF